MNSVSLDELKILEKNIKKELIIDYSCFIPKENADFWLENEYFNKENYSNKKALSKYQGELLRNLFSELINIEEENNVESKNLKEGLVEYYVNKFSNEKNIEINKRPDLKSKLNNATEIANKLGKNLDSIVFSGTFENINEAVHNFDSNKSNEKSTTPSLTLIYDNNEQFIKYIDENHETHLVKSENQKKVSKLYKKLINSNTNLNEIFKQLTSVTNDDNNEIKSEEINVLDFIKPEKEEINNMEINESVINNVISDITSNENEELEAIENINNKSNVNDNEIDYELYEKTLEEGVLEPIVEDNYNLETPKELENNKIEYKNDESYDFDKTGYIELIKENQSVDNNFKNNNEEESIKEETINDENSNIEENMDNENVEVTKVLATTDNFKDEVISNKIDNSENENNQAENIKQNKKDDMYMIFYIFAITVSVALIIGIIILKYYS